MCFHPKKERERGCRGRASSEFANAKTKGYRVMVGANATMVMVDMVVMLVEGMVERVTMEAMAEEPTIRQRLRLL